MTSYITSTMASPGLLPLSHGIRVHNYSRCCNCHQNPMDVGRLHSFAINLSPVGLRQDSSALQLLNRVYAPAGHVPSRCKTLLCRSVLISGGGTGTPLIKSATIILTRSYDVLRGSPVLLQLIPALGIIAFAVCGLEPLLRVARILFLQRTDSSWKKSSSHYIMTSYFQPLLLWTGAMLICRALDPLVLPSEASQAVKQRLLNFVRSLSTVLSVAYCLSSLIQQVQKFFMEASDSCDTRNMGFDFAGKAVYMAVWVAAVSLFMELLGFSTQRWLTAGGLGTVLLTLAGREIFTNFLSSVMIHATRPFVVNEWIQTKIQGYEVSGIVEHVGWWSPTIVRGDDREAVHIPNHKFTVNVVRNLSQKSHWRIKTHLAISHLDVNKINVRNLGLHASKTCSRTLRCGSVFKWKLISFFYVQNIVADMRKVLAKNPQVEQQKLHRRVFLENVNPENQALMILISCFVKTSHFEEYLCVKEAILMDLLRVISHHRARLATPIRTVQKMYSDADLDNITFADIFTRTRAATNRPFMVIDTPYKVNGDDKVKPSIHRNEEKDAKVDESLTSDSRDDTLASITASTSSVISKDKLKPNSEVQTENTVSGTSLQKPAQTLQPEKEGSEDPGKETPVVVLKDIAQSVMPENPPITSSESGGGEIASANSQAKQDDEKSVVPSSSFKTSLEENILLGVALEGSKRTLPIDEDINPSIPVESQEFAPQRNGSGTPPAGKDKKDTFPNAKRSD